MSRGTNQVARNVLFFGKYIIIAVVDFVRKLTSHKFLSFQTLEMCQWSGA